MTALSKVRMARAVVQAIRRLPEPPPADDTHVAHVARREDLPELYRRAQLVLAEAAVPLVAPGANALPVLPDLVQEMRDGMLLAAKRAHLPPRFAGEPAPDRAGIMIKDTTSGRSAVVGLYAFGAVRQVLADLFGEDANG